MSHQNRVPDLIALAVAAVRRAEDSARQHYGIDLPEAEIDFSLRGRCAGQVRFNRQGRSVLRLNRQLLAENLDDFLAQTIPHEVAHLVVYWQSRDSLTKPRPHGDEWQTVMQDCYGLTARRCHSYKTTPARVVSRPFLYRCRCRQHHLTSIMHKKLRRSVQAFCTSCKAPLEFVARR